MSDELKAMAELNVMHAFSAIPVDDRIAILETMPRVSVLSDSTKTALDKAVKNDGGFLLGLEETLRTWVIDELIPISTNTVVEELTTSLYEDEWDTNPRTATYSQLKKEEIEERYGLPAGSFDELIAYSAQGLLDLSIIEKNGINNSFEDGLQNSDKLGNAINELSAEIVRKGTKRDVDTLYGFLSWDKSKEFPLSFSTPQFFTSRDGSGHTHLLPPEAIVSITNDMLASVVAGSVPQLRLDMAEFAKNNKMVFDAHDFNLGIIELKTVLPKMLDEKLER